MVGAFIIWAIHNGRKAERESKAELERFNAIQREADAKYRARRNAEDIAHKAAFKPELQRKPQYKQSPIKRAAGNPSQQT